MNKERLLNNAEELTTEIAQKVRDSVSCIIGGSRNSTNDIQIWKKITSYLTSKTIIIILWLEEDRKSQKYSCKIADYQKKLQSKLKWLTGKSNLIRIYNQKNYNNIIDLVVKNK